MNIYISRLFSPLLNLSLKTKNVMGRSRGFCFTWNNYPNDHEDRLQFEAKYLVYGREVGESGTPHLQGYVYFNDGKTLASVRRLLPGSHVETAKTISAAIEYCKKDGDFVERGQPPVDPVKKGRVEQLRWEAAWESAKKGMLEEIPADIRIRQYSAIKRIGKDYMSLPGLLHSPCGVWIHGESGSGKTSTVFKKYPDLFTKNASKWWDGYQGQEVVLLDDCGHGEAVWIGRFLKIWSDKYPFIGECKGSSVSIRPKKFIVTSQYTIESLFNDKETQDALIRRFIIIEKNKNQEILL